ncbi:UDP-glucose-4-epimerase [Rhodosporidiobolus nylandii]
MASPRKTILVTGAAGYIGSHIALCCLLSGKYSVVTIDNFSNSFPTALKRVSQLAQEALPADASEEEKKACEIAVVRGDIAKKDDIEAIFKDYEGKGGIWGVIHVAALKAVGESGEIPIKYYENNITATINLLDARLFSPCFYSLRALTQSP